MSILANCLYSDSFSFLGCGASKKKAKHEAAKNILTKLKAAQKYVQASTFNENLSNAKSDETQNNSIHSTRPSTASAVVNVQLPNLETDLMSPYDDGISGNPVGELQVCIHFESDYVSL